jgi:O-acetyl-ADP-ribose deacetylase (regulator of RNase III)
VRCTAPQAPSWPKSAPPLAPLRPGECVVTGGHQLPNRYVIHCLGPVYGLDEPSSDLLASCYRCALEVAEHHLMESVAFPAISTGAFGYPVQDAARVAIGAVAAAAPQLSHIRLVRMVLADRTAFAAHQFALDELAT